MRIEFKPHGYQQLIIEHSLRLERNNIFAGMGMGKTVSELTVIDYRNLLEGTIPTLVVAPRRVALSVWPREVEKWKHLENLRVSAVVGSEKERMLALKQDANVFTINYEQLPWLVELYAQKKRWPFKRIIADESTRLKNFRLRQGGVRSKALARVAHGPVLDWTNLTGTPAPNGLANLWGQMWFIDCGKRLGHSYEAFKQRWFQKAYDSFGLTPVAWGQEQIQDAIRDVTLALDPKDWFELKDPIVRNIYIDLPPVARTKYREMEKQMFTELEHDGAMKGVEAVNAAARTIKCLQMANGATYIEKDNNTKWADTHDEKLEALASIVEEANGMPVLVAYQWQSDLHRILKAFPQARYLDDTMQTEDDWNAGKIPILVAHPKSAGHGLNLQKGGNIIAFFGMWWDLELYQQIIERIGPMRQKQAGLDRNVWIYHILARDTVDEDVLCRIETKREVQDILMSSQRRVR